MAAHSGQSQSTAASAVRETGVPMITISFSIPLSQLPGEQLPFMTEGPSGPPPVPQELVEKLVSEVKTVGDSDCPVNADCDENCAICLNRYVVNEKVLSLPCKHAFHEDCVINWLRLHNSCPNCRTPLPCEGEHSNPAENQPSPADFLRMLTRVFQYPSGEENETTTEPTPPRDAERDQVDGTPNPTELLQTLATFFENIGSQSSDHTGQGSDESTGTEHEATDGEQGGQDSREGPEQFLAGRESDSGLVGNLVHGPGLFGFLMGILNYIPATDDATEEDQPSTQVVPTENTVVPGERPRRNVDLSLMVEIHTARPPMQPHLVEAPQQVEENVECGKLDDDQETYWILPQENMVDQDVAEGSQGASSPLVESETRGVPPSVTENESIGVTQGPASVSSGSEARFPMPDLAQCSIRTLRALLDAMHVEHAHCTEIYELVELLEHQAGFVENNV
uniref:RING-type domain-containing protein n=1 Tax=Mucochytrium quahogii TaxID=96639 RepID=A0A7S2R9H4_9STRA|mmetsp:Transcript_6666/g.10501  ORF Transcript_6666/g.10501 Transcript_6666/m.10501 type:complete len:452 (-) Transcript_6666:39-1394(-)